LSGQLSDQIPIVTILSGDDLLGREKAKEQLFENLYRTHGSFIEEYFDSSRESLSEYCVRIITPTIFGDVRLFHLKHVQKLNAADQKELGKILSFSHDALYILVEYESDGEKGLSTALKISELKKRTDVAILSFAKPKKHLMAQWLTDQVTQLFGRRIDMAAAEQILEFTGYELDRIYPELQKIDIYLPEGAVITTASVATVTGSGREVSVYDLCNAVGMRNWSEVYDISEKLFEENSVPVMMFVSSLFRHFWGLYKIRIYGEQNRATANRYFNARFKEKSDIAAEIAISVGLITEATKSRVYPMIVIPKVIDQAVKYSLEELRAILDRIYRYDREIKSGQAETTLDSFRMICYDLVRTGKGGS